MSELLKVANAACEDLLQKQAGKHPIQEAFGIPAYYHDIPTKNQMVALMNKDDAQAELKYLDSPEGVEAGAHMARRQGDIAAGVLGAGAGALMRYAGSGALKSLGAGAGTALGAAALFRGLNYATPDELQMGTRRAVVAQRLRKLNKQEK